jgi:DNA polymerase-1
VGFFFSQQKQKAAKRGPKGPRTAANSKQNADILHRIGCKVCPLNNADVQTPKMPPTLARNTLVYFLAEAPGKHEDETSGSPLTGPSGALLRECIPDGYGNSCSFDNVCNCRPPGNRTPVWTEIECCRPRRVQFIEQAKPKLIVGLGAVPLGAMLASTDLAGMRGRVFAIKIGNHHCWYMPTYHPSFILRVAFDKKKPLKSKMGHCFKMDIKKAFRLAKALPEAKVDTEAEARAGIQCFDGSGGLAPLLALLQAARKAPIKAIDIETSALRPYAANSRILTVAISFGSTNFAFAFDHPRAKWNANERGQLAVALEEILTDDTIKIAHNAPFEIEWFIDFYGKEVVNHLAWECTMMQAHFIDERRGRQVSGDDNKRAAYQGLGFLCKMYFGIDIKKVFKLPKKDMASADLNETLLYCGADTKYTLRLFNTQASWLEEAGLTDAYYEALPRQPTVALMQHIGIDIDQDEIKASQKKLEAEIKDITDKINALKVVKAYIADHKEFNPASGLDTLAIFKDYLKCTELLVTDKSGAERYSTDKNVLDKIEHPLAKLIIEFRNRSKLRSTNVDCYELGKGEYIWPNGKLHTNFNTTFTETGRLSSDEPNQQNWPRRNDSWVRKAVVPLKGHVILAFDYGQLEACTAAMCSKDKVLVKALWENYDIHMEWTERLVKEYPLFLGGTESLADKLTAKRYRSIVKNKLVFPAIFGASNSSIAGYLKTPEDKIDILMDEFWRTFSGLKNWQDRLMTGYYEDGYVTSLTGRRHNYPLTRNEAINFPVQGVAADIVCDAMNRLSYNAVESKRWHLHPVLNIHDDLTLVCPDDDKQLEETIKIVCKTMLTPHYDFINVPMSVECSIGHNWYEMKDIGKFWSHKDI